MYRVLLVAAAGLMLSVSLARAEELWVISAGDEFGYFIDADSIVTVPGDVRKANVHQIFFQLRDVGLDVPIRVVSLEIDFDCVAGAYQQLLGIGIDDAMNQITSFDASESKPLTAGTNIGVAGDFACAAQEARTQFAQKLGGNASLADAARATQALGGSETP